MSTMTPDTTDLARSFVRSKGKGRAKDSQDAVGDGQEYDLNSSVEDTLEMDWRDLLRATLRLRGHKQPLAVLLFFLDGVALLRSVSSADDGQALQTSASDIQYITEQYLSYMDTMYLSHDSSTSATPALLSPEPPFHVSSKVLPALLLLLTAGASDSEAVQQALHAACIEALDWLQKWQDEKGVGLFSAMISKPAINADTMGDFNNEPTAEQSRDLNGNHNGNASPHVGRRNEGKPASRQSKDFVLIAFKNILAYGTIPPPNKLLQATLCRALSESRASRTAATASTTTSLASVINDNNRSDASILPLLPTAPPRLTLKKSSELPIDVGTQRWVLASLLHHYLGEDFGQTKQSDGVTMYARNQQDDLAIREYFPDPRRFSLVDMELSPSPSTSDSLATLSKDRVVKGLLEASKRDDKLKWLLGENVHTETVGRLVPLPTVGPVQTNVKSSRNTRMVARSPIAYHPRRKPSNDQDWLFNSDLQEVISYRRRSSSAYSIPLSPPHRTAWSADSDLARLKQAEMEDENASRLDTSGNNGGVYSRASMDTSSSAHGWNGSGSLSRIESTETFDSHRRLLSPRPARSDSILSGPSGSTHADSRVCLPTVEDKSPQESPEVDQTPILGSSKPFMNLEPARASFDSVRSEPILPTRSAHLPPTVNELSAVEKQALVKRNKKLKAILGQSLEEDMDLVRRPTQGSKLEHPQTEAMLLAGVHIQREHDCKTETLEAMSFAPTRISSPQPSFLGYGDGAAESSDMSRASSAPAHHSRGGPTDFPVSSNTASLSVSERGREGKSIRRQTEASPLSPGAPSFISDDGSLSSPVATTGRPAISAAEAARIARRKKLMKVQAFLGERVPPSALSYKIGEISQPSLAHRKGIPMLAKASSNIQRRLAKSRYINDSQKSFSDRETEYRNGSNNTSKNRKVRKASSQSMDERSRSNSQASDSNNEVTSIMPVGFGVGPLYRSTGPYSRREDSVGEIAQSAEPVILAVRRARKLEKVFGALPPTQLYAKSNRPADPREGRYPDDNLSFVSKASRSSIYRARIASLRYIAESGDPDLIDDFAKVVLSDASDESDDDASLSRAVRKQPRSPARRRPAAKSAGYQIGSSESEPEEEALQHDESNAFTVRQASSDGDELRPSEEKGGSRSSYETGTSLSHLSGSSIKGDLQSRLLGSSPHSASGGQEILRQRYGGKHTTQQKRDSVISGVTAQSSTGSAYAVDGFGRPQRSLSRASAATSGGGGTPRSSMESVRIQFRRAHKLATVFGTTRGEVFNRVLDDIEADIAEADDEDLDEEEKKEIIESVTALRASL